jgi:hypothetical protein
VQQLHHQAHEPDEEDPDLDVPFRARRRCTFGVLRHGRSISHVLCDHPRLEIICRAKEPLFLPSDKALPDPFGGQLARTHAG